MKNYKKLGMSQSLESSQGDIVTANGVKKPGSCRFCSKVKCRFDFWKTRRPWSEKYHEYILTTKNFTVEKALKSRIKMMPVSKETVRDMDILDNLHPSLSSCHFVILGAMDLEGRMGGILET